MRELNENNRLEPSKPIFLPLLNIPLGLPDDKHTVYTTR